MRDPSSPPAAISLQDWFLSGEVEALFFEIGSRGQEEMQG